MTIYSISNNKISITVNSIGAELVSLKSNTTELLWQADKAVWARYAPVLFPIVGKLKNNEFNLEGETYTMPQHGFARDLEFVLLAKSENSLEFELCANEETQKNYPFQFSLRIKYVLEENNLKIKYFVFNPDNKELYFSIGSHPGFNCERISGETLNDFYLEFQNKNELTIEKLSDGLLSGKTSVVKLDSNKLELSSKLFESDALVFKNTQIETVKLCSTKSKQQLTLNCKNWPYFGVWSKKGSNAFVCLEPWFGIADSVNSLREITNKEGIIKLNAYQTFEAGFDIGISD